jgi:hypothetical protein
LVGQLEEARKAEFLVGQPEETRKVEFCLDSLKRREKDDVRTGFIESKT